MDLYSEIVAEQPERMCKAGMMLRELDPDDLAGLEKALSDPRITQISIVNVLSRRGIEIDRDTFSRHVRGKCVCAR